MIARAEKCRFVFRLVALATVLSFSWTFLLAGTCLAQTKVEVPSGTVVFVTTNTMISPEQAKIGDTVELTVANDVVIGGKTVIRAGAPAKGEIVASKDQNYIGIAGKIGLTLRSVEAVDGSTIQISGSKIVEGKDKMVMSIGLSLVCCLLFALIKGGEAVLPAGTQIEATVASTSMVEA
jgi:hypothetical protein